MKKTSFSILLLITLLLLGSCVKSGGSQSNGSHSGGGDLPPPSQEVEVLQVVVTDDGIDPTYIRTALGDCFGKISIVGVSATQLKNEIIIGRSERPASASAYRALERQLDGREDYDGWVIYLKDGKLAVAYSSEVALHYATDALKKLAEDGEIFERTDGTIAKDSFVTAERVDQIRDEEREKRFAALEEVIGKEAVNSLRSLYAFYDIELYLWLADLYDPAIGGFYYSNSARNTLGFLPDVESTAQVLQFLGNSGILAEYDNSYAKAFAAYPQMRETIIGFVKGLQSAKNGYFYHPQWSDEKLGDARLGRDLDFATLIIEAFGEQPLYDTPNGKAGELGAPAVSIAVPDARLLESRARAVSRVVAVSTGNLPAHLKSPEAFADYVQSLNISVDSYSAGNTLASQYGQIKLAGDEYVEYLINYLNRTQDPDTGVWENEVNYSSINGLMKIGGIYNYYSLPIPNIDAALESTVVVLKNPSLTSFSIYDEHVCSVYNPWVILRYLIDSAKKNFGDDKAQQMREYIRSEAGELLAVTLDKATLFKRENGGFSYLRNSTSATSQGATVAVSGTLESDVNATTILSASMMYNVFYALGVDAVPLYCREDGELFFEAMLSLEAVIKDPPRPVETVTFDEYIEDDGTELGVVEQPANGVCFVIGDDELDNNGRYKWFTSEIVRNPAQGATDSDLVLKTDTYLYSNEVKTAPSQPSYTKYNIGVTNKGGNCHVFDADLMFTSGTLTMAQIFFFAQDGNAFSLNVTAYSLGEERFIKIGENYEGTDGVKNNEIARLIPFDNWFNLRIEVYKEYDSDGVLSVIGKIYVNGVCVGECDAGYSVDGSFADMKISGVSVQHYRHSQTTLYFNNVKCEQLNKKYIPEAKEPEAPRDSGSADFEGGECNTPYLTNFVCYGSSPVNVEEKDAIGEGFVPITEYSVSNDPSGAANKVLKVVCTGENDHSAGFTRLTPFVAEPKGKQYVLDMKIYIAEARWSGDVTQLHFVNSGIANLVSFRIVADKGSDSFGIIANNSGGSGTESIVSGLPTCAWVAIRIEWYRGESEEDTRAKVYIGISGGELTLVSDAPAYVPTAFSSELSQVRFQHQRTNASVVYFDDVSLLRT